MFYGSLTRLLFFIKRLVSRLGWVFFFFFFWRVVDHELICVSKERNEFEDTRCFWRNWLENCEKKRRRFRTFERSMLHGGIIIHGHETKPREIWSTLPKIRKGFYENLALKSRLTPLQFEIHTGFCQNVERSLGKSRMNCKSETLVWISSSEIYAFQHFKFKNEILRRKIFKLNSP